MTSKYSDTEILYVNLSAEAEALRMRAEANENRLESLLAKVEPPQPAPRSLIPTPSGSLNPSAPPKEYVFLLICHMHITYMCESGWLHGNFELANRHDYLAKNEFMEADRG